VLELVLELSLVHEPAWLLVHFPQTESVTSLASSPERVACMAATLAHILAVVDDNLVLEVPQEEPDHAHCTSSPVNQVLCSMDRYLKLQRYH